MRTAPFTMAIAATWFVAAPPALLPAQYRSGSLPAVPQQVVGSGEVILEVSVNRSGAVSDVKAVRSTPPFTELVKTAVEGWQFEPAKADGPVDSIVLVAAVFRPPTINTPAIGAHPSTTASPSRAIPLPLTMELPPYPPRATGSRVVLVEARISADAAVTGAKIIGGTSGFDGAALAALHHWAFRAAEVDGARVSSVAYLMFGFRPPTTDTK